MWPKYFYEIQKGMCTIYDLVIRKIDFRILIIFNFFIDERKFE